MPSLELGIARPISPETQYFLDLAEIFDPASFAPQKSGLYALITHLESLSPTKHIPSEVVAYACGLSIVTNTPFALFQHESTRSIAEKVNILSRQEGLPLLVEPLKTITLGLRNQGVSRHVLLTGLGDFRIDDQTKQDLLPPLQKILHTDKNVVREVTINPREINPLQLGTEAGIVSPFVRLGKNSPITCLLYYYPSWYKDFVAIAVSLRHTMVISQALFWNTLCWWNMDNLGIPSKQVFRTAMHDNSVSSALPDVRDIPMNRQEGKAR